LLWRRHRVISACDVVIAADNALFSITEVRWGLTAAIIIRTV
jgi:methylglutaconyl-CoA hydratase